MLVPQEFYLVTLNIIVSPYDRTLHFQYWATGNKFDCEVCILIVHLSSLDPMRCLDLSTDHKLITLILFCIVYVYIYLDKLPIGGGREVGQCSCLRYFHSDIS